MENKMPFFKKLWFWILLDCIMVGFIGSRLVKPNGEGNQGLIYVFVLLLSIVAVVLIHNGINKKRKHKAAGVISEFSGMLVSGLPLQINSKVNLLLFSDLLVLRGKGMTAQIKLQDIKVATSMKYNDFAQVDKSVVGRAVVGGVLLGPVGAVVGGVSGVGKKNKAGDYLVLNYIDSSGQLAAIVLNTLTIASAQRFARDINNFANVGIVNL